MQPATLSLVALLAPLPAAAFGDLDCISFESCGNGGCGPHAAPFGVTCDWAADRAVVSASGVDHPLPLNTRGETDDTVLTEFGDMDDTNRLLRIEASSGDITAYYTFKAPSVTTWVATCTDRRAA